MNGTVDGMGSSAGGRVGAGRGAGSDITGGVAAAAEVTGGAAANAAGGEKAGATGRVICKTRVSTAITRTKAIE